MTSEELKNIAAQLQQPSGAKGIEMARMMNETNIRMTHHSIDQLHLRPGNRVLELGHGNAGHLYYVLAKADALIYHGLEISELMQQEAIRMNFQSVDKGKATFNRYDGILIPYEDHFFDAIFTVNTLYFWTEPLLLLSEMYRVLQPEGTVNITFAHASSMKQLPFTAYGFTLYEIDDITKLIGQTTFTVHDIDTQTEQVKSKTGESIERTFSTITLKKHP